MEIQKYRKNKNEDLINGNINKNGKWLMEHEIKLYGYGKNNIPITKLYDYGKNNIPITKLYGYGKNIIPNTIYKLYNSVKLYSSVRLYNSVSLSSSLKNGAFGPIFSINAIC